MLATKSRAVFTAISKFKATVDCFAFLLRIIKAMVAGNWAVSA